MTGRMKVKRRLLQQLWNTGTSLELECDLVDRWMTDTTPNHIHGVMIFQDIITKRLWRVETEMVAPLFEPFGFHETVDGLDEVLCREVAEVETTSTIFAEVHTTASLPPTLSVQTLFG